MSVDENWLQLAYCLWGEGKDEQALALLSRVEEESFRECEKFYTIQLHCLFGLKRYGEVEEVARGLIERDVRASRSAWFLLIVVLKISGRIEEMKVTAVEAQRYWPNDDTFLGWGEDSD